MGSGRVCVVCDAPILLAALAMLAERSEVCACSSLGEAASAAAGSGPGVALVASSVLAAMPDAAFTELCDGFVGVVVVDAPHEAGVARAFMSAGARGYLSRLAAPAEVSLAMTVVQAGKRYVEAALQEQVLWHAVDGPRAVPTSPLLTAREREVAALLAQGRTAVEIAAALFVSAATARTHIKRIYVKAGAHNRVDAVARLARLGEVDRDHVVPHLGDTARRPFAA